MLGAGFALIASPALSAQDDFAWKPVASQPSEPITFTDRKGRPVGLAAFRGRPVLLNLWATWCAPCILELPALDRLQHDFGTDRLTVLALSLDRLGMPEVLIAYERLGLKHLPAYVDATGDSASRLGIVGLPATWAIDASGKLLASRRGAVEWDDPRERRTLRELLKI